LSYLDKNAKKSVTYKYRVRAIKGGTYSSYRTTDEIVFLTSPELITCEKIEDCNSLVFGEVKGATKYNIYRKTIFTDWVLIGAVDGSADTIYNDRDIMEGTEYTYTVKAVNGDSVSSFDEEGISC